MGYLDDLNENQISFYELLFNWIAKWRDSRLKYKTVFWWDGKEETGNLSDIAVRFQKKKIISSQNYGS